MTYTCGPRYYEAGPMACPECGPFCPDCGAQVNEAAAPAKALGQPPADKMIRSASNKGNPEKLRR